MTAEDIYEPTKEQMDNFKKIIPLLEDNNKFFLLRVSRRNLISGLDVGDVLLISREQEPKLQNIKIYRDLKEFSFTVTRNERKDLEYWGKAIFVLRSV